MLLFTNSIGWPITLLDLSLNVKFPANSPKKTANETVPVLNPISYDDNPDIGDIPIYSPALRLRRTAIC